MGQLQSGCRQEIESWMLSSSLFEGKVSQELDFKASSVWSWFAELAASQGTQAPS